MSKDMEQFEEDDSSGKGAADITEALAEQETTFVAEEGEKKGSGGLILFGLVLAAIGGTYFMYLKTGPKAALAASAESTDAGKTIKQFLADGHVSLKAMEDMRKNTEKVVQRFLNYPSMTQVPLSALKTNPFRATPETPVADVTEAASRRKREQQREEATKAVQGLSLQSVIVSGNQSACIINKTLYTQGQQVDIFTIEKITNGAVIVNANGFRFKLEMTK